MTSEKFCLRITAATKRFEDYSENNETNKKSLGLGYLNHLLLKKVSSKPLATYPTTYVKIPDSKTCFEFYNS